VRMIDVPLLGPTVPRAHAHATAAFGRLMLTLAGWRIEGQLPDAPKFVLNVVPHTSNWDFPVGLMAKFALRLGCRFIAKQSLFWWPLGSFLRFVGGLPVNRTDAGDVVGDAARAFANSAQLVLVITPEGTRSRVDRWKSGFHRIARAAGVPVALAVFDYRAKIVRLGPSFPATEDYDGDLAKMQSHITAAMAKHPDRYGQ
jgi:1-acyl-sn-glycerol-3-phosphate acyltransferase